MECDGCGAQTGEVRVQTMGEGTPEQWDKNAKADALKEWNTRAALQAQPPQEPTNQGEKG
jgi:hypothetical protein